MIQTFSPIQNQILSTLKNAKALRYSELQIDGVSNDLFNYHLQHLVKKGFVIKDADGYSLSDSGIQYMADPYPIQDVQNSFFKMNVITILIRENNSHIEVLNQVRKSNPSYGKIGVMGGVVLKGERIEDAAHRKLYQETGLKADFTLVGCERRIMYRSGTLFSDVLFPITYATQHNGNLIVDSDYGHNLWVSIDEAINNESVEYDSIKSVVGVLNAIKKNNVTTQPFFFEETIQDDRLSQ